MKTCLFLPLFLLSLFINLHAELAVELELVGAAHNKTPVRFDGDLGSQLIAWAPYGTPLSREIGLLEFFETKGKIIEENGSIAGEISVKLPPPGSAHRRGAFIPNTFKLTGIISGQVISGTWQRGQDSGVLHGFVHPISKADDWESGAVTLDCAYPFSGREGAEGYQGLQTRLGASFTLKNGTITGGIVGPNGPRISWFPGRSFNPAKWVLPTGQEILISAHGYEHEDGKVSGQIKEDVLQIQMQSKVHRQIVPVVWNMNLRRYGTVWVGKWKWEIEKGQKDMSRWAVARLGSEQKKVSVTSKAETQREQLLQHATALYNHPSNVIWRDEVLAMTVKGTGNKNYDNPPNNVGAAILTGLLLYKLSPDPYLQAEGRAMARRAAYWWTLARYGPLQLGEYYKGMFWCTSWAGFGLAELTEAEPDGPWNLWATELAKSIQQVQLPSGAWTWVDEGDASLGRANHRNDRSCDNRELNCGDVLLALSMLSDALDLDLKDSETRGKAFLSKTLASPPEWFFQDRRPGDTSETLGTVCYFQWLVQQKELDLEEIAKVRKLIDSQFFHPEAPKFLKGCMPRWTPGHSEGPAIDLSVTARYANSLATLGKRHSDTSATDRAKELVEAIFQKASGAESGLMDYLGRKLPSDPKALGQEDAHSYLCLKAALGWELLQALETLG